MEHVHNVTRYRSRYQTLVIDVISYNLRIIQGYFQPKIGRKNKNIQPRPETKKKSVKKKRVYRKSPKNVLSNIIRYNQTGLLNADLKVETFNTASSNLLREKHPRTTRIS